MWYLKPLFDELLNLEHKYFWGFIKSCIFKILLAWDAKISKYIYKVNWTFSFLWWASIFFTHLREWSGCASVKFFSEKSKNKEDTLLALCSVIVNRLISHVPQVLLYFSDVYVCMYIYISHLLSVGLEVKPSSNHF